MRTRPGLPLVVLVVLLGGCGHVAPYEREELAKPTMDVSGEESETMFRSHVYDAREGATGGGETAGGGCGCN